VYIKHPVISDTLLIHSSETLDVCVHVFFYTWFSSDGSDEPKHVG